MKIANDSRHITARFSKAAHTYDSQPGIQAETARRLAEKLEGQRKIEVSSILEAGCGTGFLTKELCQRFPDTRIVAFDIAGPMIERAQRQLGRQTNLTLLQADIRELSMPENFSLIVSSSALHWMLPLEETFNLLQSHLRRKGRIFFAMMTTGTLGELHYIRNQIAPHKCLQWNLPSVAATAKAMRTNGFEVTCWQLQTRCVQYASPAVFLNTIHRQGVTGGFSSSENILNPGEMRRLICEYQQRYSSPGGGVYASYNILYAAGIKI